MNKLDEMKNAVMQYRQVRDKIMKKESDLSEDEWKTLNNITIKTAKFVIGYSESREFLSVSRYVEDSIKKNSKKVTDYSYKLDQVVGKAMMNDALAFFNLDKDVFLESCKKDPFQMKVLLFEKAEDKKDNAFNNIKDLSSANKYNIEKYKQIYDLDEVLKETGGTFDEAHVLFKRARDLIVKSVDLSSIEELTDLVKFEDRIIKVKNELIVIVYASTYHEYLQMSIDRGIQLNYNEVEKHRIEAVKKEEEKVAALGKEIDDLQAESSRLDIIVKAKKETEKQISTSIKNQIDAFRIVQKQGQMRINVEDRQKLSDKAIGVQTDKQNDNPSDTKNDVHVGWIYLKNDEKDIDGWYKNEPKSNGLHVGMDKAFKRPIGSIKSKLYDILVGEIKIREEEEKDDKE